MFSFVDKRGKRLGVPPEFQVDIHYTFFFIRTPNFSPRLDVLIFSAISASNVLFNVLNHYTLKMRYSYSTTVYLILNITVFSLS